MTGIVEFLTARLDEQENAEKARGFHGFGGWISWADRGDLGADNARYLVMERVIYLLALPYAGHPDFDPSWGQQ